MTSQINPALIDTTYPIAGVDNPSQGFRTNFTNTATNFQFASNEISDLQSKAVLKAALTGGTLDNNMSGALLSSAQIQNFSATVVALGTQTGTVGIVYGAGHYQTLTTNGAINLAFSGWPATGQEGWLTVAVTVTSTAHTLTLPSAVSQGTTGVTGLTPSTNVIHFAATGTYAFTFTTVDGGTTIRLTDANTSLRAFSASSETLTSGAAASLATNVSMISTLAPSTATLAAGVEGQVKTFAMVSASGSMTITVAASGWNGGGSGTVTLSTTGATATLKVIDGRWFVIGSNAASFA